MSGYTPTWFEVREQVEDNTPFTADEFDRMIDQERAEERERAERELSQPAHVQIAARKSGKHSTLADMIVERANAKGIRVEFVTPDREPSDAEVRAVVGEVYGPGEPDEWQMDNARAALLAAQEVRDVS